MAFSWFNFTVHAWTDTWVPPARAGWVWVPGFWGPGHFVPGYWAPTRAVPVVAGVPYRYVPGWWVGDAYVEGYYRPEVRDQGDWTWVDGYYRDDGTYVWGDWVPATAAPAGYIWVPGFWDGETWVGGFWRPEHRNSYVWVGAWYDDQGIFHSGYWEPTTAKLGETWIPGWFDGEQWTEGYWVTDEDAAAADPESWVAPQGWDEGWEEEDDSAQLESAETDDGSLPLALPVSIGEEQTDASDVGSGDYHAPPPGTE